MEKLLFFNCFNQSNIKVTIPILDKSSFYTMQVGREEEMRGTYLASVFPAWTYVPNTQIAFCGFRNVGWTSACLNYNFIK